MERQPSRSQLSREQITAILSALDRNTWSGHSDAVMLANTYITGARVSEITALRMSDILIDRQSAVLLHGKGRKQRATPIWKNTASDLRGWQSRINPAADTPVFPNRAGAPMSRSGMRGRLDHPVAITTQTCPSLRDLHVPPHTIRHTTAIHLLQSGTDLATIALSWGHSSPATTHRYLEAKEAAPQHLPNPSPAPTRFQPGDQLLGFLKGL